MRPLISVAIVSYNTRALLERCLASLVDSPFHQVLPPAIEFVGEEATTACQREAEGEACADCPIPQLRRAPAPDGRISIEIIVVDNGSSDGSLEMIRDEFPQVGAIRSETNIGFARATNAAIRASRGHHVLLLNPDTEVRGDALPVLARFLDEHPRCAAVGPRLLNPDGSIQPSAFTFPTLLMVFLDFFPLLGGRLMETRWNGRYPRRDQPFPIDHPLGACMLLRRAALDQVGWLDPGYFMYCEELDWCMRARRFGWEIWHEPRALVVHHGGASTRQRRDAMFVALHASRLRFYRRWHSYTWVVAAAAITRLGVWAEARRALREARRGHLSQEELESRLAALAEVHDLARAAMLPTPPAAEAPPASDAPRPVP